MTTYTAATIPNTWFGRRITYAPGRVGRLDAVIPHGDRVTLTITNRHGRIWVPLHPETRIELVKEET